MVGKFVALALFFAAVFATYGTNSILGSSAYRAHQTTDAMLDAIEELTDN